MCGIAGYIGAAPLDEARVTRALSLMHRRGPDHASRKHFQTPSGQHVHLLHSRLRIVDLDERSNQPFQIGSKWIVFNGEIYNYLELKKELVAAGRSFRTTSDTEVLLSALQHHGVAETLDRAEGMWAFAVYDEADGS